MFVQVIEGHTSDAAGLERQMERWRDELREGADGFLGSTSGVTDDGHVIVIARFESAEAARANSQRPEQGDWWRETEGFFDSDVTFVDSEDVELPIAGGTDRARFVQVMKGDHGDRASIHELDELLADEGLRYRPDVIGMTRTWTGPESYVQAIYFTNEEDARAGESAEVPIDLRERMAPLEPAMGEVEFYDLHHPVLY